jgi:hypothetical protein
MYEWTVVRSAHGNFSLNSNSLDVKSVVVIKAGQVLGTTKDFVGHVASFDDSSAVDAAFTVDTLNDFVKVRKLPTCCVCMRSCICACIYACTHESMHAFACAILSPCW